MKISFGFLLTSLYSLGLLTDGKDVQYFKSKIISKRLKSPIANLFKNWKWATSKNLKAFQIRKGK